LANGDAMPDIPKGLDSMTIKIHAGYKISYDCPQPTPMILALSVHPSLREVTPVEVARIA
jgi:hypothetical protein